MSTLAPLVRAARSAGHTQLTEEEGLAIAADLGLRVPRALRVDGSGDLRTLDLSLLPGPRVAVKLLSRSVLHKSDRGGVALVERRAEAVAAAIATMERRFTPEERAGFLVAEEIRFDRDLGGELLFGLRWTPDFGPVLAVGPGGTATELLAAAGHRPILCASVLGDRESLRATIARSPLLAAMTEGHRGAAPRLPGHQLVAFIQRWLEWAHTTMPDPLLELELNPVVISGGELVALDAVARISRASDRPPAASVEPPRGRLERLLSPRSIAIAGVSARLNPGRIILRNLLAMGYPRERILVVKPGVASVEGCRAVPALVALPEPVDLLVLAVAAARVPAMIEEVVAHRRAEAVILIPGGLGESPGSEGHAARIRSVLDRSRATAWGGPVVNGGNCLGVRSRPGKIDTLFIPDHKLSFRAARPSPLALVTQSGAFAVARASALWTLDPRYVVTVGNQIDLTVGHYVAHLARDPEVEIFACYVEGFRPGDGTRLLGTARELAAAGRPLVLYRAGRTPAGAAATASHTASLAGDAVVTRALAETAGVLVADTLADFDDLVRLFCGLRGRRATGSRVGAVSNAGFECVAIADALSGLRLASLEPVTTARIQTTFREHRLDSVVGVRNPVDTTPILDDEGFAHVARAVIEDPGVDLGVIGCVPLTGALSTVAPGPGHGEDAARADAVAPRIVRLFHETTTPWVAVVDGGPLFDPMVRILEAGGVPTFRTADRALRLLAVWAGWQTRYGGHVTA